MKKLLWALTLVFTAVSFASCDEIGKPVDPEDPDKEVCEVCGEDPCECEDPSPGTDPLQPSKQKEKLSSVGQKLIDMVPVEEWEKYSQFAEELANSVYVSEDYDWGTVYDWFEDHAEDAYKEDNGKLIINGNKYSNEWITEVVILMSNHTGLFTCTEDGVTISDYDGTKAVFTLNGKKYEAEIKSSGKVTQVRYVWEDTDKYESSYYYDPDKQDWVYLNNYVDYSSYEKVIVKVGVPEQIDITLTENGAPMLSATMKFTPSFENEDMDLTTDAFSTKTTVSINGFEVVADKVAYDGVKGEAAYKTSFKKNGETIISSSASAELKLNIETQVYENDSFYEECQYIIAEKAQDINVEMQILDEIQIKGSCSNAIEVAEELEAMWDELSHYYPETGEEKNPNLDEAKRHLNNINAKFKIYVYYDGTDVKQATITLALSSYTYEWDDYTYYDVIPILEFSDGSKYKIEEFFTENAFSNLIDSFYELYEAYYEVFGFSIE